MTPGQLSANFINKYSSQLAGADIDSVLRAFWFFSKDRVDVADKFFYTPIKEVKKIGQYDPENLTPEFLSLKGTLNKVCGVYRLWDENKRLLYIGKSDSLYYRLISSAKQQKATYVSYSLTVSNAEACVMEAVLINALKPLRNVDYPKYNKKLVGFYLNEEFTDLIKIYIKTIEI